MIVLAIFGGIDTTRNQIALAMDMFVQHPDQWKLLGEDPELARAAVEEVMRVRPTVTWVTREALEDFNYQGLDIKKRTTTCSAKRRVPIRAYSKIPDSISRPNARRTSVLAQALTIASDTSLPAAT